MMKRDRGSNSANVRRPRVKTNVSSAKLDIPTQPPPLVRSNTLPPNYTNVPRVPRSPRSSSLGLSDKEKARSDDGFHSDSDKDSNQSANSNISIHSSKGYLTKSPSTKSNVVVKVRPKSSLGTMSDNSSSDKSKVEIDIATLNRQFKADKQAEEAKKNRKIEDLEISIKTLTKFNAELEATNKKQAAEIQELKRKLNINDSFMSIYESDDDNEVSTPLSEIDLVEIGKDNDARFRQICMMITELIQNANNAIAYKSKIGGGSKVLTNAQLDPDSEKFQNTYTDESDESPKSLKVLKESEFNSEEKINICTKSDSSVVSEQTFVNDPKIKLTIENDNANSTIQLSNLFLAGHEKNQILQANIERARTVANELLSLEKQDNNVNITPHNSERKGLGLLLPNQNGHSLYITHNSINGSDSSQPSPRMLLLYELQESLGIGNAESSKYLKENRRSLPVMSSSKINFIISPSEESQKDDVSRPSSRSQTQSNKSYVYRRRSSPNFRTKSMSNIIITDHTNSSIIKNDSILNSLPHGSDEKRSSIWTFFPLKK